MAGTGSYDLSDEEVTEFNPNDAGAGIEEVPIGLPDTPGKSYLPESAMNLPDHPPDQDAPDSMTKAVMENLRVGAGITDRTPPRDNDEGHLTDALDNPPDDSI